MSEEIAGTTPESVNPTALSLALAGASREEADAFLRDQRHHIHEQLKQIHLDLWEKWLGVLLRCATLAVISPSERAASRAARPDLAPPSAFVARWPSLR